MIFVGRDLPSALTLVVGEPWPPFGDLGATLLGGVGRGEDGALAMGDVSSFIASERGATLGDTAVVSFATFTKNKELDYTISHCHNTNLNNNII